MIERVYDHLTSLGLPDIAAKAIFAAAFCVPLVLLVLNLPNVLGGSHAVPTAASAPSVNPESKITFADGNAPRKIEPDSKKAEFAKVRLGMTLQQVQAIMGKGELVNEQSTGGHTSAVFSYSYADNTVQFVMIANGEVLDLITKKYDK